jgi:hypothetical protein
LTLANNDGLSRTGIKSKVAVKEKPLIVSDPQHVLQGKREPAPWATPYENLITEVAPAETGCAG